MNLNVSPPIQLILVLSLVSAGVAALLPDAIELPDSTSKTVSSSHRRPPAVQSHTEGGDLPWQRPDLPEPEETKESSANITEVPPLPTQAGALSAADQTPPLPMSPPAAHDHPDLVYLGRMTKDNKTQIFLASHGQTSVVSEGDVVDGMWLVQSITVGNISLRNVNNGSTHEIATSDSTNSHQTDVKPVQIGPRFLATN